MRVVPREKSLVSVIIPVYNCGRFLARAIDSAREQSYRTVEIIVVDDGSTDDTPAVVSGYGNQIVSITQENRGVSAARNGAVRRASGDYLAFLDADDLWHREKLSLQVAVLDRYPALDLVCSDFNMIDEEDGVIGSCYLEKHYPVFARHNLSVRTIFHKKKRFRMSMNGQGERTFDLWVGNVFPTLFMGNFVNTSSVVMRRSAFAFAGGFDDTRVTQEDYELWLKVAASSSLCYVDRPLVDTRKRAGQLTEVENRHQISTDVLHVLESQAKRANDLLNDQDVKRRLAFVRNQVARAKFGRGDRLGGRVILRRAFAERTCTVQTFLLFCWSFIPAGMSQWLVKARRSVKAFFAGTSVS